ncbi:MAG: response regulator transcription factor [Candidatus Kapaibacterium sp.]
MTEQITAADNKSTIPCVLLIDGRPVMQEALKLFLITDMDMHVKTANTFSQAFELLQKANEFQASHQDHIDVVILDVLWARSAVLEIVQTLKKDFPRLPILVISTGYDDKFATRVLKLGASGYKSCLASVDQFQEAINAVLSGRKYISPLVTKQVLADTFQKDDMLPHEVLSDREYQILIMIAQGKTVGEIGVELHLSVKTISTYRSRVLDKLHLKNNAQIMQYAVGNSLI